MPTVAGMTPGVREHVVLAPMTRREVPLFLDTIGLFTPFCYRRGEELADKTCFCARRGGLWPKPRSVALPGECAPAAPAHARLQS